MKAIAKALAATPTTRRGRACAPHAATTTRCLSACCRSRGCCGATCAATRRCSSPGSLFVTQALDRRASGTYYTPRSLAEEVVQHALDPVAYAPGPAEERDPAHWRLRPAAELLDLKVADIAMGSGAFLVAACRYLAARLLEAWAALEDDVEWTAFGRPRADAPDEPPCPPSSRNASCSRTASSPSAAFTASTRTRWRSRWQSSRCG